MISKVIDRVVETKTGLRGGDGNVLMAPLFDEHVPHLSLCNVVDLEPGCSIGKHTHQDNSEIYYILEGEATVYDEDLGNETVLKPGEAHLCRDGQAHYIKNNSSQKVSFLAIIPSLAE